MTRSATEERREREAGRWEAETYDAWQEAHDGTYRTVIELASRVLKKGDVLLEIGCGTGLVTFGVAPAVERLVATDLSEPMLNEARKRAEDVQPPNIEFRQEDAYRLSDGDATYDAVLCCYVIDVVEQPIVVLDEAHRVLKEGGRLISVTDCTPWWKPRALLRWTTFRARQLLNLPRKTTYNPPPTRWLKRLHARAGFRLVETTILPVSDDIFNLAVICEKI